METWEEMMMRHNREKIDLVRAYAEEGFTQTQAANILGMQRAHLNMFAKRNEIKWPNMQRRCYEPRTFSSPKSRIRFSQ